MRDPTGVVQESASPVVQYAGGKDYAGKVNFNCMATSGARARNATSARPCKSTVASLRCCGCRRPHGKYCMVAGSWDIQIQHSDFTASYAGGVCGGKPERTAHSLP
jgi:hypothetical protein